MLVFNCTKAATEFFARSVKGKKHSVIEPCDHKTIEASILAHQQTTNNPSERPSQWHWLVHVITVKRKKVVIIMDYHSRFSMTFTHLKKGDEIAFLNMFESHLSLHVQLILKSLVDDFSEIDNSMANYNTAHSECTFHQRGDRSVQATLNDVAWHFENRVHEQGYMLEDFDLITFDSFTNQLLRQRKKAKGYFYPHHQFLHAWLTHYSDCNEQQVTKKVEMLKQLEREAHSLEYASIDELETVTLIDDDTTIDLTNVVSLDDFRKINNNASFT